MSKKMPKQFIVLQGKANSGKTHTLGMLHDEFIPSKMKVVADSFTEIGKDFCTILEFRKYKIGITTHGKSIEELQSVLDHFVEEKCDIIICEYRNREYIKMNGDKKSYDLKIRLKGYNSSLVKKQISKNNIEAQGLNEEDAEQLFVRVMREFIMVGVME